ncbi:MAG: SpoIIE family protein phosphatase, partial [Fretibacterium sp.]|nr:SpoIIE family protein phosphatase [Fretibacterium sp.]
ESGDSEGYYNYSTSDWYKRAQSIERVCFTDVYQDSYGRGPTITCAAPFYDAKGEFAGVVGMDILITDLYRAVVALDLGEGAYAFLLDHKGNTIGPEGAASGGEAVGRIAVLDGKQKVFLSGDGVYYAQERIKSTGWTFGIRIPEAVILAPVRSVNRTVILTMLLFLAAFAVIVALVFLVARRFSASLTGPIAVLKKDVEKISGGNLDYHARICDNDEIGDLAGSFNEMAASLKDYIKNLAAVTAEKERIGAELNVATQIQADMLPRIFPPFPERKEFALYATMTPAKEVGGDFYDFFLIDDDHLALVIADVSGKGVPAALFMVIAKTLIKNRAQMGGTPSEILSAVNEQLCDGNEAGLFVTVWLGILEISTGKGVAANAGHEYPVIKRAGLPWELQKAKHSPAVAVREGMKFRETEFELNPGDRLYLYTDGVAEATNAENQLFGTDRMIEALNRHADDPVEELLPSIKREVDSFVGDAPQFDDITMLTLWMN